MLPSDKRQARDNLKLSLYELLIKKNTEKTFRV